MTFIRTISLGLALCAAGALPAAENTAPKLSLNGDWTVDVSAKNNDGRELKGSFEIEAAPLFKVDGEKLDKLPLYNPKGWQFNKGYKLAKLRAQECCIKYALVPESLKIVDASKPANAYVKGKDYEAELDWGAVGRLPGGAIGEKQPVLISYEYGSQRIDGIVISADGGKLLLKKGTPDISMPRAPKLEKGEIPVANIFITPRLAKLSDANLFPITETAYPDELAASAKGVAGKLLPKTMEKLRDGGHLKILAWGDSVTDGGFLPEKDKNRWQAQFVARLKEKYPKADIELVTEAWGGRNTDSYFAEKPGSLHNYQEKVLAVKPDLIVTEFINDKGFTPAKTMERYAKLLADFKAIGAEWIINTPHYDMPEWRGLKGQKSVDEDPNAYVKTLREFAAQNGIPLSDVSARYGRLWRQGVPYMTYMMNGVNHPCPEGMKIYADSLINLFP